MPNKRRPRATKAYRQAKERLRGRPCIYCGKPSDTVEHLRPIALGGDDSPDNLAPACQRCNSSRGAVLGNRLKAQRPKTPRRPKLPPRWTPTPDRYTTRRGSQHTTPQGHRDGVPLPPRWRQTPDG